LGSGGREKDFFGVNLLESCRRGKNAVSTIKAWGGVKRDSGVKVCTREMKD
jgi:hypothetical protein